MNCQAFLIGMSEANHTDGGGSLLFL